jgi:hypothetical protein
MAKRDRDEEAHDILAADEFPPPATADADTPLARARRLPPDLTGDPGHPHDILAADEFPPPAMADADTPFARAHRLPPDLTGDPLHAHDILAAEAFAMPSPDAMWVPVPPEQRRAGWGRLAAAAAFGAVLALRLRRR